MINKRLSGAVYEKKAADYMKDGGYTILCMNYRCRLGEIDIVAKENDTLVFAEVKYRKTNAYGMPEEAVGYHKQKKICDVAGYYLMKHSTSAHLNVRFDVVSILGDEVKIYKNAFEYIYA